MTNNREGCVIKLLHHKRCNDEQDVYDAARQGDQVGCPFQGRGDAAQQEIDGQQNPCQHMAPADDKKAKICGSHGLLLRPDKGKNDGDHEGDGGPYEP